MLGGGFKTVTGSVTDSLPSRGRATAGPKLDLRNPAYIDGVTDIHDVSVVSPPKVVVPWQDMIFDLAE
ncbi:hypothetical protein RIF29_34433 [Crotalaria pallida]|uniref:Uncharacterized protein n=1 Tax=Crotalaria pallida TaxID=3830 RepID=A0AAN9E9F1_CROPI